MQDDCLKSLAYALQRPATILLRLARNMPQTPLDYDLHLVFQAIHNRGVTVCNQQRPTEFFQSIHAIFEQVVP